MSSFFDAPPPPDPPGRLWAGRREAAVIGKTVALNLVIGRSDKAALWIPALTASADGFEFGLELRHDLEEEEFGHPFFFDHHPRRRRRTSEGGLDPELLRFGVQFSDGRKATNIDSHIPSRTGRDNPADGPVLMGRGGGGGQGRWRQDFSVSPLPPAGPLAFVCEWPIAAIPETRNEIDSALVRDAASEAVLLWAGTETAEDPGSWTTQQVALTPEPPEPPDQPDPTG